MSTVTKPSTRVRALGAGVALALCALVSTGCDTIADTASTVESIAAKTPKQKLIAAAPVPTTQPFAFTVKGHDAGTPTDVSGVIAAPGKAYEIKTRIKDADLGFVLNMDFRVVAQKSWVRIVFQNTQGLQGLPKLPKKWMLLDPAKIKDKESTPLAFEEAEIDPGNTGVLFTSIVAAVEAAGGKYTGTLDLTKAAEVEVVDKATLTALGVKAKALPFTATLDASGRVTAFALPIPAAGSTRAFTYAVTYTGYGTTPAVTAPAAAETAAATAAAYQMLNS